MQRRPLYIPYAHVRNFIFIEKSVRSYTTKDTVYLIHIKSDMGAFASKFLLLGEVLPKYLPLINFNAYYLHLHLLQCRRYKDFISFLYYYTFMAELWILSNEVCWKKNTYTGQIRIRVLLSKNISDFTKNISLRLLKSYLGVQVEVL